MSFELSFENKKKKISQSGMGNRLKPKTANHFRTKKEFRNSRLTISPNELRQKKWIQ